MSGRFVPQHRRTDHVESRWMICTNPRPSYDRFSRTPCGSLVDTGWWDMGHARRCFSRELRDLGPTAAFAMFYVPEESYAGPGD